MLLIYLIKCTAKNEIPASHREYLEKNKHKFSIALKITELPQSRANNKLYNEITNINTVENIIDIQTDLEAELG